MNDTSGKCGELLKVQEHIVCGVNSEKKCVFCGFLCDSRDTLFNHVENAHGISQDYACRVCKKTFPDSKDLQEHLEIHNEFHIYDCKKCKKTFANNITFIGHECLSREENFLHKTFSHEDEEKLENNLTSEINEKILSSLKPDGLYHCTEKNCKKTYKTSGWIKHHLCRHFDNLPYECVSCAKRLLTERELRGHLLGHTKRRSYECEVCKKTFTTKNILKQHLSIHRKNYKCIHCKKEFARKWSLTIHLKTVECCSLKFPCATLFLEHESKVVHVRRCNFCPAAYPMRRVLLHHLATKHYELTTSMSGKYECPMCNRRFTTVINGNKHIKRKHSHLRSYYSR